MKTYLILLLSFFSFHICNAQQIHVLSGTIQQSNHYQGGSEYPIELVVPRPKPNFTMWVVREISPSEKPRLIRQIRTDSLGRFSIVLPPGKYGFVLEEDLDSLQAGQFLPRTESEYTTHEYWGSSWSMSNGPSQPYAVGFEMLKYVEIEDSSVSNIYILNSVSSGCMDCP
jgi:hypothetical protein